MENLVSYPVKVADAVHCKWSFKGEKGGMRDFFYKMYRNPFHTSPSERSSLGGHKNRY